jgi:hypothetical protein
MCRSLLYLTTLFLLISNSYIYGQTPVNAKTEIKDEAAKTKLLGDHPLSLQWVSWSNFGKAGITDNNGTLVVKGEQKSKKGDEYLSINGVITMVDAKEFKFNGTIITRVSFINGGKPCERKGEMTFRITGNRKFWRLKEMDNPCEAVVDYVDIRFK